MTTKRIPGWVKRLKIPAIIIVSVIVLWTIAGFWIAPYLIKSKLPDIIAEYADRKGSIQDVSINPFLLTVDLKGFEIEKKQGGRFIAFEQLFVDLEISSLFKRAVAFREARLVKPYVEVNILKNRELNFADLLTDSEEDEDQPSEEQSKQPFPVWISDLEIQQGQFIFKDLSLKTPFTSDLSPIDLTVKNFQTYLDDDSDYTFSASFASGGKLNWSGDFNVSPLRSHGRIEVAGIPPLLIWKYVQDSVEFDITGGTFQLTARYRFAKEQDNMQLVVSDGNYRLENFKLAEKNSKSPVIDIPNVTINGINLDLAKQLITADSVRSDKGFIHGWVTPEKHLNFQSLFAIKTDRRGQQPAPADQAAKTEKSTQAPVPAKPAGKTPTDKLAAKAADVVETHLTAKSGTGWLLRVGELKLNQYNIKFEDRSLDTAMTLNFTPFDLTLKDFSSDLKNKLPLVINSGVNQKGHLNVKGNLGLSPVSTDVDIDIKLDLVDFQPYIDPVVKLKFEQGYANVKGQVDFKLDQESKPQVSYQGMASVHDFVAKDKIEKQKLFNWKSLIFDGVDFNLDPMTVGIKDVRVDNAYVRFIINKNGTTNFSKVFAQGDTQNQKSGAKQQLETQEGPPPVVKINTARIKNASAQFADNSLTPGFATSLESLNGTIKGLSTTNNSRAKIDIKGKADKTAPATIKGQIDTSDPSRYTDIGLNFKNLSLTTLTPYSGKFAGYKIKKGKMSVDLHYSIDNQRLVAKNKIVIDQLTLGDKVESPDAVDLPLSLAIALLKDSKGVIDIELPLQGSLDNPEFSIWGIVGDVLMNLITKAVTAPFAMIGSLVGGGDEALDSIEFTPGQSALPDDQKEKLGKVVEALNQRPALRLEIEGSAAKKDAENLFTNQILVLKSSNQQPDQEDATGEEQQKTDWGNQPGPETTLSDEEYRRYLLQAYYKKITGMKNLSPTARMITLQMNSEETLTKAEEKVLGALLTESKELRTLAQDRGRTIREYLISKGLNADRIFLLNVSLDPSPDSDAKIAGVASKLSLTAN